jgi:hypothetical protein
VTVKLLLMSIVIASVFFPLWAARDPSARRGLRKTILAVLAFNLIYMLLLRFVYPRL